MEHRPLWVHSLATLPRILTRKEARIMIDTRLELFLPPKAGRRYYMLTASFP